MDARSRPARLVLASGLVTVLIAAWMLLSGPPSSAASAARGAATDPTNSSSTADTGERLADWHPDLAAARAFAASRRGTVRFAVRGASPVMADRLGKSRVRTASVLKAMLLVAYLRRSSVRHRDLTDADTRLLSPMIRRSDNVAATIVRDRVGNAALRRLALHAEMKAFTPRPIWGMSLTTARDQARFFFRIDHLVPARHRAYAMRLLRTIVGSQRWGVGEVRPAGWRLYFKGGWGSGVGLVDHQVALLTRGDLRVSVAVMTTDQGSHAYGKRTLRGMFARLTRGLAAVDRP